MSLYIRLNLPALTDKDRVDIKLAVECNAVDLLEAMIERGITLIALKEGLDLSNAAGRLMANVLASVAQFETEARAERVLAGQKAARDAGKRWGGCGILPRRAWHDRGALQ